MTSDSIQLKSNKYHLRNDHGDTIDSYVNDNLPVSKTFAGFVPDPVNITANGGSITCGSIGKMKITIIKSQDINTNKIVITTNISFTKTSKGYYNYPDQGLPITILFLSKDGGEIITWHYTNSLTFDCKDVEALVSGSKKDYQEDWFDLATGVKILFGVGKFIQCGYN